jgi:hypothetical protein
MNAQRPNTALDDVYLNESIILCCGEDWNELVQAMGRVTAETPLLLHEYRSYRVARYRSFSLISSGMGTGCLEPLLYELSSAAFIRNIVLIGTAGATKANARLEEVHIAAKAFLGATAVDSPVNGAPLVPRFPRTALERTRLGTASVVSSDYYYGFSNNPESQKLRAADSRLQSAVHALFDKADLIDMETAQFYYFCAKLFPRDDFQYVALKGAANSVADQSSQAAHTMEVLQKCITAAFVLLGLDTQAVPAADAQPTAVAPSAEASSSKLMEEVKLFWTIQIAVCAVLGYLGNNLVLGPVSAESHESVYLKNLCISIVSFFLIQIGAVYNLIGNYYARLAASGSPFGSQQENRVTPTLALFYLVLSGALAALGAKTGLQHNPERWVPVAALLGVAVNYVVCRGWIYRGLAIRHSEYISYAKPMRRAYDTVTALLIAALGWYCLKRWLGY